MQPEELVGKLSIAYLADCVNILYNLRELDFSVQLPIFFVDGCKITVLCRLLSVLPSGTTDYRQLNNDLCHISVSFIRYYIDKR